MRTITGFFGLLLAVVFSPSTGQGGEAPGTWAGRIRLGAMASPEENTVAPIRGTRGAPTPYPAFGSA